MKWSRVGLAAAAAAAVAAPLAGTPVLAAPLPVPVLCSGAATAAVPGVPYYGIELVPTGRVPGTREAGGIAAVRFADSPFGVALSADGSYRQVVTFRPEGLRAPGSGGYVAWVTTQDLSIVRRLGRLEPDGNLTASVDWNKFLVVVTLESNPDDDSATAWSGPIVLRGASRSGRMHTLAGHGAFQAEPCIKYGY